MEKKEEKKFSTNEKLVALQIAQSMGGFDAMTMANEEKYISTLINRAEMILKLIDDDKKQYCKDYFVRKDI